MGYKRMTKEDIYEILRRWHAGQNVSRIADVEKCGRKTIFKYIKKFNEAGFGRDTKLPDKERIWDIFEQKILPSVERHRPASKQLEPLEDIIRDLASCHFVEQKRNLVVAGPSGIGKTHIAKAIGHEVCRRGENVIFKKTGKLQELMEIPQSERAC